MKSIKTIFNEVYSEGLAEYGFKKVPGKYPYFARMVGDEIIQVITYRTVSGRFPELRELVLLSGVITVYRDSLKFDFPPDGMTEVLVFVRRFVCLRHKEKRRRFYEKKEWNEV